MSGRSTSGRGRVRDRLATYNERVKLTAGFFNAVSLGLVGFAVLRPVTEDIASVGWESAIWTLLALAMQGFAHYILGRMQREADHDGP